MIKSIWVDNFKSLVNFEIELAKFNCVVGLNGVGKSTLLQSLDFVSQLMVGDIEEWLKSRHWDASDLNSRLTKKRNIDFRVILEIDSTDFEWSGSFNQSSLCCTKESISENGNKILAVEDGVYTFDGRRHDIVFDYQGSLLSRLKENQLGPKLKAVKDQILNIRSLDLISPELLRSRARSSEGKLGLGGENLSALIHESGSESKEKLKQKLFEVYPQLDSITTKSLRSGWKQLEIHEHFGSRKLTSTARHTNDGMLRMMAILMQLDIGNAFLLFDEIENGINPELIEYLVDHLVEADDQILVTTHSPMILNFMEDDVARSGVHYLYKTKEGYTRTIRLFDIPSLSEKLKFMGPGEAFIDTDLSELYLEIESMTSQEA
jgi:predicted ATPase